MQSFDRRSFLKTSTTALSILPFLSLLSACKKKDSSPFKIGFLTPKTGNDAQAGLSCERGAKIAESFLRELGLEASLTIVDTESNIETGRIKAEKLIQNGAHCLVGAFNSAVSSVIAQVANNYSIPYIIDLSVADQLTEQNQKFTFRNFPSATIIGEQSINNLQSLFKENAIEFKTATLLVLNDAYGQAELNTFNKNRDLLPFEIEEVIQFDYKAKDLSSEIFKVKKINSDVLIVISRSNTTNIIVKELIVQNHNPKLIIGPANQGFFEKQFFNNFKEKSDNLYTIHAWLDSSSKLTSLASKLFYKEFPDEIFELNAAFSLEAIYIAALAFKMAQSTKGEDLRHALSIMNEPEKLMHGNNISFDEKGQRQTLKLVTLMNRNEKTYIVHPKEYKEIDAVLPFPGFG
ncbi:MAG: ABC transporter substrate-binding protein [Proteobacteria bacterium]|nr:ABC transporter substrate-binding protein [Pseudomonadota bacterium]